MSNEHKRIIVPQEDIFRSWGVYNILVKDMRFDDLNKKLDINCKITSAKDLGELDAIYEKIKNRFAREFEVNFKLTFEEKNLSEEDIRNIIERAIKRLKARNAIAKAFMYIYRIEFGKINDDIFVKVLLTDDISMENLIEQKTNIKLEELLHNYGLPNSRVEFEIGDFENEKSEIVELTKDQMEKFARELESENSKIVDNKKIIENKAPSAKKTPSVKFYQSNNYGKGGGFPNSKGNPYPKRRKKWDSAINGTPISIDEFYKLLEQDTCIVEGDAFNVELRSINSKKEEFKDSVILSIGLTDNKNSLTAELFFKTKPDYELEIHVGDRLRISGSKRINMRSNEPTLSIECINHLEKTENKKTDNSTEKYVELHTHTKMSEMVGVENAADIVKRAISYGHKAVAITDYAVVHSFPEAYKTAKKAENFKAILGCEMYMIDDTKPIVTNAKDIEIDDETFVVFDLETMGLNSHLNEILEIGAVKMKGTRIVDTFSQLIDPGKHIPQRISELTNITDEMVAGKPNIQEVIAKFKEFLGDATLVAHNAVFDVGFIKRDIKKYLGIDYLPTFIDTIDLARVFFPDLKSYNLDKMNKTLGLSLENHHRAVDDAQATAKMFSIFLDKFKDLNVTNIKNFDKTFPKGWINRRTSNVIVLACDHEGLKNLYKLISYAHIDYFGNKKPRIPRSVLEENRKGLLIGCSLTAHYKNESNLVSDYFGYNFESLDRNIKLYDYIELLPKIAYSELIEEEDTGTIASLDDIEEMNKFFYQKAKENNIQVTGSSDVHYLDPEENLFRSILLYSNEPMFQKKKKENEEAVDFSTLTDKEQEKEKAAEKRFRRNFKYYQTDNGFYYRTTEELLSEFEYMGKDIAHEIVINNTNSIADKIEVIEPIPTGFYPPHLDNAEETIKSMTYEKAYRIYGDPLPEIVDKRLKRELDAIINHGFSVLYLSAQKLVKKSLDMGYLVGSRGSVGSSLVAFMMGITEVNALYPHYICDDPQCKYSEFIEKEGIGVDLPPKNCPKCGKPLRRDGFTIPFEVFMGFDGDKTPDIDLNFSSECQTDIHRYCETMFGRENVFKAGTISTVADKTAFGYIKAYYREHDENVSTAEVLRLVQYIQGGKRTTGQHPGGMIVLPKDHSIYEFCPVQKPANDQSSDSITTHFDYHVMDEQLVKLDLLGHDDPTMIKLLQEYTGIDIFKVPLNDKETLELFSSTESLGVTSEQIGSSVGTYGVPEFGTHFVRKVLVETKPTTFAELVRISGLSHGTDVWTNNAEELVNKKVATLSEIITVRDDIMNYLIDQGVEKLTSFKIMEFVRRGKPSKPDNQADWEKYKEIMKEKNVPQWYIDSCSKIKYMFPKGHASAYVMMAMRIAYFKVHYPLAFYAAYFSRKASDFDFELMFDINKVKTNLKELNSEQKLDAAKKVQVTLYEILIEMNARKIEFLPVDIYLSDGYRFKIEGEKIRIPLVSFSGLGEAVIDNIVKERTMGEFLSYEDLKKRTKVSTTLIEKMKKHGAITKLSETNQKSLF